MSNNLIPKQIGSPNDLRHLTRKQIDSRMQGGVHVATRSKVHLNKIKDEIKSGKAKDGIGLSEDTTHRIMTNMINTMCKASKEGGNALNTDFESFCRGKEKDIFIDAKDVTHTVNSDAEHIDVKNARKDFDAKDKAFNSADKAVKDLEKELEEINKLLAGPESGSKRTKTNAALDKAKKNKATAKKEKDAAEKKLEEVTKEHENDEASSSEKDKDVGSNKDIKAAQKAVAADAFKAIKAQANIVASSSGFMLLAGRMLSHFSRFPGMGLANKGLRKLFGTAMGHEKVANVSEKFKRNTPDFDDRIIRDTPDVALYKADSDKGQKTRRNHIVGKAKKLTTGLKGSATEQKEARMAMHTFVTSIKDLSQKGLDKLDKDLETEGLAPVKSLVTDFFEGMDKKSINDAYKDDRAFLPSMHHILSQFIESEAEKRTSQEDKDLGELLDKVQDVFIDNAWAKLTKAKVNPRGNEGKTSEKVVNAMNDFIESLDGFEKEHFTVLDKELKDAYEDGTVPVLTNVKSMISNFFTKSGFINIPNLYKDKKMEEKAKNIFAQLPEIASKYQDKKFKDKIGQVCMRMYKEIPSIKEQARLVLEN